MPDWREHVRRRLPPEAASHPRGSEAIDELADHLERVYRAALAAGRSEDDARADADAELDDARALARVLRTHRLRPIAGLQALTSGASTDVRRAARMLRTRPAASAVVIITLAVGIGVCTAVFSLVNAVLLGTAPYPDAHRLVLVWEADPEDPDDGYIASAPNYRDWVDRARTVDGLAMWENLTFNVSASAEPQHVAGVRATANLFSVLGVPPARGRGFTVDEESTGDAVAVISDAVWRAQFGRDESILTRQIRLNDEPHDVIGVLPPGVEFPSAGAGIIIPMGQRPGDDERDSHSFYVVGRLRDGATFEASRTEFDAIGRALAEAYPANRGETVRPTRLQEFGLRRLRPMLGALMGAAVLVLVIACVNVANLQLALATARRREWTMRAALGASVGHLIRQTLLESLTLAAAGGLAGVVVAWAATGAFDALLGAGFLSFWFRGDVGVTLDGRVLAFATATSAFCAVIFGLAPFAAIRRSMSGSLREDARGATTSHQRTRRVLVAAEVALSIVVLTGAGLLIRSLVGVLRIDPGLDADRVVTLRVSLPQPDPYGRATRTTFCADLSRAASAAAAFESVSAVSHLPLSGANAGRGFTIEGRPAPQPNEGPGANYRVVCPGYFAALRIPVIDGRDIDLTTQADLRGAVVLNRATAEKFWPNERAVGRRIKIGGFTSDAPWLTIVGVVENVRHFALDTEPLPEIFVPYGQAAWPVMTLVGRTRAEPTADSMLALRDVLRGVDPQLPATRMMTMASVVDSSVNWRASFMRLLVVFGVVGLLLAGVGVYAVLAHFVANRRREVGLRMALGATRSSVVSLVMRQSMSPVLAGVALGAAGSAFAARWLVDFLYQVEPGDPPTTLAIAALVVSIGLLASWMPARRAASTDPTVALRED